MEVEYCFPEQSIIIMFHVCYSDFPEHIVHYSAITAKWSNIASRKHIVTTLVHVTSLYKMFSFCIHSDEM